MTRCEPKGAKLENLPDDLLNQLDNIWPSLGARRRSIVWKIAYQTLGSCVIKRSAECPAEMYFRTALDLATQWNVTKMLEEANIKPDNGKPQPARAVYEAIRKGFGKGFSLLCMRNTKDEQILHSMMLYFDAATLAVSNDAHKAASICNPEEDLWYLTSDAPSGGARRCRASSQLKKRLRSGARWRRYEARDRRNARRFYQ